MLSPTFPRCPTIVPTCRRRTCSTSTNSLYILPVGGFHFLTDAVLLAFDVFSLPADSPMGYFVECDLHYPAELHALHNAYPLVPEYVHIFEEMLSDTLRLMQDVTGVSHCHARS